MLSQFYTEPINGWAWPVAASYSNGFRCPRSPEAPETWALVSCNCTSQQIEAAAEDPRVQPYRTLWDPLTPETITAYAAAGAKAGMMLGQLLQMLAQTEPGYAVEMNVAGL